MAEDTTPVDSTTQAGDAPSSAVSIDPTEYAQLKDYYNKTNSFLQKASPYYDDINELIEDADLRTFYGTAKKSYKSLKEQRAEVSPELKPFIEKIDKMESTLNEYNSAQKAADKQRNDAAVQDAMQVIARQKAEHPELDSPEGNQFFVSVGNYAATRGVSYETAYKEFTGKLGIYRESAPRQEPPRSQRPSMTEPVSSDRQPQIKNKKDFSNYLRRTIGKAAR